MKYEFHPAALQEYAEAVQFFAQQDRHQAFIDTVEMPYLELLAHRNAGRSLKVRFVVV
jgi:toxin ParE1/3/4